MLCDLRRCDRMTLSISTTPLRQQSYLLEAHYRRYHQSLSRTVHPCAHALAGGDRTYTRLPWACHVCVVHCSLTCVASCACSGRHLLYSLLGWSCAASDDIDRLEKVHVGGWLTTGKQ